jgi:[histone H3]-lysine36 N-trimethyltransferase
VPVPDYEYDELHPNKRPKIFEDTSLTIKPLGKRSGGTLPKIPLPRPVFPPRDVSSIKNSNQFSRESIQAIIAAAAEAGVAEAAAEAAAAVAASVEEAKAGSSENGSRKKQKPPKKVLTPEEKEANKEKRLLKLIGAVVVKYMSKYSKAMDHDLFKKHAKEACAFSSSRPAYVLTPFPMTQLTQIIADKEKKSSSYKEWKLDRLSDEKVAKIKKFAKEYIAKVLRKLEKPGHRPRPSSSTATQATSSTSLDTPNSAEGVDGVTADMSMSVEEAMDMDPDSDSDGDEEEDDVEGHEVEHGINGFSPSKNFPGTSPETTGDMMDVDESPDLSGHPSDPRRRPPVGRGDSEYDPRPPCVNGVAGMS